jgi:hypothetical protein
VQRHGFGCDAGRKREKTRLRLGDGEEGIRHDSPAEVDQLDRVAGVCRRETAPRSAIA